MDTKYRDVSNETQKIFNEVLDATSIPHWIDFVVRADDTQKKRVALAIKQNELNKHLSGNDVAVIINEAIFDELEEEYQKKVIEEALGGVVHDENGKVKVTPRDYSTYSGYLEKYGADDALILDLHIKSLYEAKKEREDAEKE